MTDRELLELAAKAAGIALTWDGDVPYRTKASGQRVPWAPLENQNDARMLLVRCQNRQSASVAPAGAYSKRYMRSIVVAAADAGQAVLIADRAKTTEQNISDLVLTRDMTRKERRAAFLAAAEIGKGME